jgi:hypothetical protein
MLTVTECAMAKPLGLDLTTVAFAGLAVAAPRAPLSVPVVCGHFCFWLRSRPAS